MASFRDKFGWHWTDDERHQRQANVRQAKRLLDRIREQVRRIGLHIPQFKPQAEEALRQIQAGIGKIAEMNLGSRGPKYHPLSPEQADCILSSLPGLLKPWEQFVSSADVSAASRQKNREIRKRNVLVRIHYQAVAAQQAAMWDQFAGVLQKVDEGDVLGALERASDMGIL